MYRVNLVAMSDHYVRSLPVRDVAWVVATKKGVKNTHTHTISMYIHILSPPSFSLCGRGLVFYTQNDEYRIRRDFRCVEIFMGPLNHKN